MKKSISYKIEEAKNGNQEAIEYICKYYDDKIKKSYNFFKDKYDLGILDEDDIRQDCYIGILKCLKSSKDFQHNCFIYMLNEILIDIRNNSKTIRLPQYLYYTNIENNFLVEHIPLHMCKNIKDIDDPIDNIESEIDNKLIIQYFKNNNSKRNLKIFYMYYIEHYTMKQIGDVYKLTKSRINQILESTKYKLIFQLQQYKELQNEIKSKWN